MVCHLLEVYPQEMARFTNTKPGFFSPLAAYKAKNTPIMARLLGDILFNQLDSPKADVKIARLSVTNRLKGVGAR